MFGTDNFAVYDHTLWWWSTGELQGQCNSDASQEVYQSAATVHELGHNLGLEHTTGGYLMDSPMKCYDDLTAFDYKEDQWQSLDFTGGERI